MPPVPLVPPVLYNVAVHLVLGAAARAEWLHKSHIWALYKLTRVSLPYRVHE